MDNFSDEQIDKFIALLAEYLTPEQMMSLSKRIGDEIFAKATTKAITSDVHKETPNITEELANLQ